MARFSCLGWLILLAIAAVIGGFALEYVVETWAAYAGNPVDVPMPHGATMVVGVLVSKIAIPLALATLFISWIGLI